MQVRCPTCQAVAGPNDINIQQLVASCRRCDSAFSFEAILPSPRHAGVARPPAVSTRTHPDYLDIRIDWSDRHHVGAMVFGIVVSLYCVVLGVATAQPLPLIPFFLFLVWMTAPGFAGVYNKTFIRVSKERIRIRHTPIAFVRAVQLDSTAIQRLLTTGPHRGRWYALRAITRQERSIKLLPAMFRRPTVLFVEQEIRRYLNENLGDVLSQFGRITCLQCDLPVDANNVNHWRQVALCASCRSVFDCSRQLFGTVRGTAPTGLSVELDDSRSLTVCYGWPRRHGLLQLIHALVSAGVCLFIVWLAPGMPQSGAWFESVRAFGILFLVGCTVSLYFAAAGLYNRTVVVVSQDVVAVRHSPIPVPGNRTLPREAIESLQAVECRGPVAPIARAFALRAVMRNGGATTLMSWVANRADAEYMVEEIERFLETPTGSYRLRARGGENRTRFNE
jgi:hypothetical protein